MTSSVQYVTDKTGKKTAVLLPIEEYERLLEDLEDLAAIAERRKEPTITHDELLRELKKDGILPACYRGYSGWASQRCL